MSALVPLLLALAVAAPAPAPPAGDAGNAKRIAVAAFRAEGGASQELAGSVADVLAVELEKFQGVELLTRNDVRAVLSREAENQLLGCDDPRCYVDVTRLLPTRRLLTGTVNKIGSALVVEAALVDLVDVRVTARASATVAGGADEVAAALESVAVGLMNGDPTLLPANASVKGEVSAEMLDRVRLAERPRGTTFTAFGGAVYSTTFALGKPSDPAYPGGLGKLSVGVPVLPWLSAVAFVDGGYYTGSFVNLATIQFLDGSDITSSNGSFVADYGIGLAEAGAGVKLQPRTGVARPYLSAALAGGVLSLDASDLVYHPDKGEPDLPASLGAPVPFRKSIAAGGGLDLAAGVDISVLEHVAVAVELGAYGRLHGLEKIFLLDNVEKHEALAPLAGATLLLGVAYEM